MGKNYYLLLQETKRKEKANRFRSHNTFGKNTFMAIFT